MLERRAKGPDKRPARREEDRELLLSGARLLGISLDMAAVAAFERFLEALIKWNQKMNLTALRERRTIVVRHFLDSLTLVREIPHEGCLLDIGSGAGFPGIPLKIVIPELRVTLLEASRKKTYFHKHVIRSLGLSGIQTVWGRSDQNGVRADLLNHFDLVVSRAAVSLEVFLKDATPFIRPRGVIIAMTGKDRHTSLSLAPLSLELCRTVSVDLPFDRIQRSLLFFRRVTDHG
jgi:16S rRNA (guanine527-N7)-methyltransferase